ncbi:MAG TPA: DUF6506 family protein [Bacillota bacterium]|nr:DUF6506 family protein [Bacillota bacterium]
MRYAFIMNSGHFTPEDYSVRYEDEGSQYYFAAVHSMDMTRDLARTLAAEGYGIIDLCGDFDEAKAEETAAASGGKIEVNYAKYTKEELEKFEALASIARYGIIVMGFDFSKTAVRLELTGDEFNTYISIVDSEETAANEAKKMAADGINFIELCGYFDLEKADRIMKAVDYKVPVGYCGK